MTLIKNRIKRKNITLSSEAESKLVKLSKILGKSQSKIIEHLILEKVKDLEKDEKIKTLYSIKDVFHGKFKEADIQSIKSKIKND